MNEVTHDDVEVKDATSVGEQGRTLIISILTELAEKQEAKDRRRGDCNRSQESHHGELPFRSLLDAPRQALLDQGYIPKDFRRETIDLCLANRRCFFVRSGLTSAQRAGIVMMALEDPTRIPAELEAISKDDLRYDDLSYWAKEDQPGILFMYEPEAGVDPIGRKYCGKLIGVVVCDLEEIGIDWFSAVKRAADLVQADVLVYNQNTISKREASLLAAQADPRIKQDIPVGSFLTQQAREEQLFVVQRYGQLALNTDALPEEVRIQITEIRAEISRLLSEFILGGGRSDSDFIAAVRVMHEKGIYVTGINVENLIDILTCGFRGGRSKIIYYGQFPEDIKDALPDTLTMCGGAWIQLSGENGETPGFPRDPLTGNEYIDLREMRAVLVANARMKEQIIRALKILEDQGVIAKGVTQY